MRGSSSFVLLLLGCVIAAGCSVQRSGLNPDAASADDLGVAPVDLGVSEVDGDAPEPDLGVIELDLGVPDLGTRCDPADCSAGRFCDGDACGYARSCNELTDAPGGPTVDGVYTLDGDGDGDGGLSPADAYCDLTSEGGGWTLVLKADGEEDTFRYDSPYWTNSEEFEGGEAMRDTNEAKLRTYLTVEFTQMRVVMVTGGVESAVVLDVGASSCVELFRRDHTSTRIDREVWLAMVPDSSLQNNCNREGINVAPAAHNARVRIGIVGNNEGDCNSPDSRIGIGGAWPNKDITTGNVARAWASRGDRNTVSFGYVFVR